ncbi:GTP-binding protein [Isoptericola chiayiensis]|uniref:GTP-binding protein n=1 Tax=Isoptericola chiayiensis TaxID=579446 RepID=A0ABP8YJK5_9MICO|nr:GTP-binding protein [Isoptericola chiayiensis]NOW00560.1 G3E family GTPase [Isoptericola chiayiensis]
MSDYRTSLSVLVGVDPVLRDSTLTGLAFDAPSTVTVKHDLHVADGTLRRVVVDVTGVVEDETIPLEHACVSCCVREDAVPTLARLAATGRWTDIVLALPVTAEPLPVTRGLAAWCRPGEELAALHLTSTAVVVDIDTAELDLLADDWCAERGLALTDDDERGVGEALVTQLEQADLVVTTGDDATGSGLVERLRAADSRRVDGLHALSVDQLAASAHRTEDAERRAHPLGARGALLPGSVGRTAGVDRSWSLELSSPRPFHPDRLLEQVEALGTGEMRARGAFWVANRPDSLCLWDGAGGQLCIADLGTWDEVAAGHEPHTRIVVVGAGTIAEGESARARLTAAFRAALATDEELADGGLAWLGGEDVLAPWLGLRHV